MTLHEWKEELKWLQEMLVEVQSIAQTFAAWKTIVEPRKTGCGNQGCKNRGKLSASISVPLLAYLQKCGKCKKISYCWILFRRLL